MPARNIHLLFLLLVAVSFSCSTSRIIAIDEMKESHHVRNDNEQKTPNNVRGRIVNETTSDVELSVSMKIAPYLEGETLFLIPSGWQRGIDEVLGVIECLSPGEEISISKLIDQYGLHPNRITNVYGITEEFPSGTVCQSYPELFTDEPRIPRIVCVEWQADDTNTFRIVKKWDCNWPPLPLEPEEEAPEDEKEGSVESGTYDREPREHCSSSARGSLFGRGAP